MGSYTRIPIADSPPNGEETIFFSFIVGINGMQGGVSCKGRIHQKGEWFIIPLGTTLGPDLRDEPVVGWIENRGKKVRYLHPPANSPLFTGGVGFFYGVLLYHKKFPVSTAGYRHQYHFLNRHFKNRWHNLAVC